jgi:hypothetical protein
LEWEHKGKKIISASLSQHGRYKRTYSNIKKKRRKRQIYEPGEDGVLNIARIVKEENGDTYTCIVYSPSGEMARRYDNNKCRIGNETKDCLKQNIQRIACYLNIYDEIF